MAEEPEVPHIKVPPLPGPGASVELVSAPCPCGCGVIMRITQERSAEDPATLLYSLEWKRG